MSALHAAEQEKIENNNGSSIPESGRFSPVDWVKSLVRRANVSTNGHGVNGSSHLKEQAPSSPSTPARHPYEMGKTVRAVKDEATLSEEQAAQWVKFCQTVSNRLQEVLNVTLNVGIRPDTSKISESISAINTMKNVLIVCEAEDISTELKRVGVQAIEKRLALSLPTIQLLASGASIIDSDLAPLIHTHSMGPDDTLGGQLSKEQVESDGVAMIANIQALQAMTPEEQKSRALVHLLTEVLGGKNEELKILFTSLSPQKQMEYAVSLFKRIWENKLWISGNFSEVADAVLELYRTHASLTERFEYDLVWHNLINCLDAASYQDQAHMFTEVQKEYSQMIKALGMVAYYEAVKQTLAQDEEFKKACIESFRLFMDGGVPAPFGEPHKAFLRIREINLRVQTEIALRIITQLQPGEIVQNNTRRLIARFNGGTYKNGTPADHADAWVKELVEVILKLKTDVSSPTQDTAATKPKRTRKTNVEEPIEILKPIIFTFKPADIKENASSGFDSSANPAA